MMRHTSESALRAPPRCVIGLRVVVVMRNLFSSSFSSGVSISSSFSNGVSLLNSSCSGVSISNSSSSGVSIPSSSSNDVSILSKALEAVVDH